MWPMQLRTSHAHDEGCERDWSVSTVAFTGSEGHVRALDAVRVVPETRDGRTTFAAVPGSEFRIDADLVLLAMGFTGPRRDGVLTQFGVELTQNGLVRTDEMHRTSIPGVFAAGDARRGASLIVWAIREGRDAAASIDAYLRAGTSAGDSLTAINSRVAVV
jgi:glutamate synthase (NADPH/NADH) small chain